MKRYFGLILALTYSAQIQAFSWFSKSTPTPQEKIQELQQKQAENPNDPQNNYNLGVALYKTENYDQACTNFSRASQNCPDKNLELKKRIYFNLANGCYKNCLAKLPSDWQKQDIDQNLLMSAVQEVKKAIENYKNTIAIQTQTQAKHNLEKSEKLLKDLEAKLTQKKQDKQDKKEQQNKDQKQDQSKQQQEKSKSQDGRSQPNNSKDKKDKDGKGDKKPDGAQNKGDNDQQKNQQQNKPEHEQKPSNNDQQNQSSGDENGKPKGKEKQEQMIPAKESGEKKMMGALLDYMQGNEAKMQKNLMARKIKAAQKPLQNNQKPW